MSILYCCLEAFTTTDGTLFEEGELIGEAAYYYLQPIDRENFIETNIEDAKHDKNS